MKDIPLVIKQKILKTKNLTSKQYENISLFVDGKLINLKYLFNLKLIFKFF